MTPTPAEFEIKRRPVWDPAPGTACIWQCIKEMPLAMHRLSDRVLGGLYVAIVCGLIKKANCNLNESDLGENFNIRVLRTNLNLGHGLLTPDGKAIVSIPVKRESKTIFLELRGAGKAYMKLPVIVYNTNVFKARYPNWAEWRNELLYEQRSDGTFDEKDFESYVGIAADSTPPDWPLGLTRDRELASEAHYRLENLNTKTGLPKDGVTKENNVQNPYSTRSQVCQPTQPDARSRRSMAKSPGSSTQELSIADIIDEKYGLKDRNRKRAVALTVNSMGPSCKIDSEDDIDTITKPRKRQMNTAVAPMPSKSPKIQKSPGLAPAPIEVHRAAFQAAFRDKSVQRTELFQALLPFITVADAEEILLRCQCVAAVISESKFE